MKKIFLTALLGIGLGLLTSGCAGYRLGSMLPPDIKTVYVPTFINNTSEPQLEVETTQALIEELQRDGSLKVVNQDMSDVTLAVTLRNYWIKPVSYRGDQRTTANRYRINIQAAMVLTRRDGTVVVDNPNVVGENVFEVAGDISSSKMIGLPLAAQRLAHDIVEKVVEYW